MRRRADWFYQQRAYPLKRIPPEGRLKALRQLDDLRARQAAPNPTFPAPALRQEWTAAG